MGDTAYNVKSDLIALGTKVYVRCNFYKESIEGAVIVGFVESFSAHKNIQVLEAKCIGEIRDISIDPVSVSVDLSLKGYIQTIPDKGNWTTSAIERSGHGGSDTGHTVASLNPDDDGFGLIGNNNKIPYLCLWDNVHQQVIGWTTEAIVTSYSISASGGGYIEGDVSLKCIEWHNGKAYKTAYPTAGATTGV